VTVKEQKWVLIEGKKVMIESADKGRQVKRDEFVQLLNLKSSESETWKEWTGLRS
jgi:hypothetical protein